LRIQDNRIISDRRINMRVKTVRVVKVKKEYMDSMSGQTRLVSIINGQLKSEEMMGFKVSEYPLTEIFMEDYYIKNYWNEKEYTKERMIHALLFGLGDFNYTFTPWQTELGILNPTEEQIAERVSEMWGVDPQDKEEIEMIANSFTNHDNLGLRYISVGDLEKVFTDLGSSNVIDISKEIEKKLNSMGISFDEISDKDIKFVENLKEFLKETIKDSIGAVYAFDDI
jgi:hypothetical protein